MKKGMEPKVIKEESAEKEGNNYTDAPSSNLRNRSNKGRDRCKTPDSPEGSHTSNQTVAVPSTSPTQSSPPPPPLIVTRHAATSGCDAAVSPSHNNNNNNNNGSVDSLTPPPPLSSGAPSVTLDANQYAAHGGAYGGGNAIARPLVKLKRFLSTLVQFGNEIGTDIGERVRSLVLNLVSSNLSVEEFHHSLQDVTNFPLRPFVLPFLRVHLPLLQREIHNLARAGKQSSLQYVRMHEHVVLDPAPQSPSEPSEIFLPMDNNNGNGAAAATTTTTTTTSSSNNNNNNVCGNKRRATDSLCENGINGQSSHQDLVEYGPIKRAPPTVQANNSSANNANNNNFLLSHQNLLLPNAGGTAHFLDTYGGQQQQQQQQNHPYAMQNHRFLDDGDAKTNSNLNPAPNRGDDEWKNIHVMLNCILSMVEKTKRALTILQQRNSQELTNEWLRKQDVGVDLKKAANEIMLQAVRQTEDRVAEVRRRAEEAVNDVKRQAVVELQKAVAVAETKANELVAAERAKMEKLLQEARKHNDADATPDAVENSASPPIAQPAPSQQNSCWNCGRKAHETCSGCGLARYCGPFCQHKDWESHHQLCAKDNKGVHRATSRCATTASNNNGSAIVVATTITTTSVAATSTPTLPSAVALTAATNVGDTVKFKK